MSYKNKINIIRNMFIVFNKKNITLKKNCIHHKLNLYFYLSRGKFL